MKSRLITTLNPPPLGFETVELSRKHLLGGPVVVLCDNPQQMIVDYKHYLSRIHGCVVHIGETLKIQTLSPSFWLLQLPESYLSDLAQLMGPLLDALQRGINFDDENTVLKRMFNRSERDLTASAKDYHRVNEYLQTKVNDLTVAQEEIVALNRKLESRVKERTADLEQSLERTKQAQEQLIQAEKLAALGSMVAGVAHEINTPLGNCVLAASNLKDTVDEVLDAVESGVVNKQNFIHNMEQLRSGFELLNTNLTRSADMVGRFKKVAVDQSHEERRDFNMLSLVEDTIAAMSPRLKRGKCQVNLSVPDNIEMDSFPGDFSQILMNLMVNSLVHGYREQPGGKIDIAIKRNGSELDIEYQDHGRGLTEEASQRLFEPFFTTNRERGGTGLGMAIIHNLISHRLGGSIQLTSKVGEGIRFKIITPVVAPAGAA
ncbi:MAG: ATP-binding protein [Motiliproteus sp.]|nr:ATP-binding protein [Motiliproteus sp.]MCW9050852.1 ATP-binding protein [Motiliproteus sp.]